MKLGYISFAIILTLVLAVSFVPSQAEDFPSTCLNSLLSQTNISHCEQIPNRSRYQLIALGFSPSVQGILEEGLKKGILLEKRYPKRLEVIEIPVLAPHYGSAKPAVTIFMKNKVIDKNLFHKIYPWYVKPEFLRKTFELHPKSEYAFILVNKKGLVLWKTQKTLTLNDLKTLEHFITSSEEPF